MKEMAIQNQNDYCVYIHINKINGKEYIGITKQKPERRWQNGKGYAGSRFENAIKKYGWESFYHLVVCSNISKEKAQAIEIDLISRHDTRNPKFGYNLSRGGETCDCIIGKTGIDHPNHQRVRMIDPKTNKVVQYFDSQSDAAKKCGINRKGITKACLGVGSATYMGFVWEYVDKEYVKPGNPGRGNYKHDKIQKRVKLYNIDGSVKEFESIKEAGILTGVNPRNIARYLRGERKDASGRRWLYVS